VVIGETSLTARELLERLLSIEREAGRRRDTAMAPRTLDLDVILFGEERIEEPGLVVPHPRFRERLFVLEPLAEVAPGWIDPATGKTISALLAERRAALPDPS
jgi:2-amino-4-hydroxy-6-hydroxymethyldihydropteridine diphosphokinase